MKLYINLLSEGGTCHGALYGFDAGRNGEKAQSAG
jgi:hypothetical protein